MTSKKAKVIRNKKAITGEREGKAVRGVCMCVRTRVRKERDTCRKPRSPNSQWTYAYLVEIKGLICGINELAEFL